MDKKKKTVEFKLGAGLAEKARKDIKNRKSRLDEMLDEMEAGRPALSDKKKKSK